MGNLDRPKSPTIDDFMAVLHQMDISANLEKFTGRILLDEGEADRVEYTLMRLCLPETRRDEVIEFLKSDPSPTSRELAVVWWDIV